MNNFSLENFSRPKLEMPNKEKKLLLHSCCAPCAGEIMEAVAASGIETTIYFYNPKIHPILVDISKLAIDQDFYYLFQ